MINKGAYTLPYFLRMVKERNIKNIYFKSNTLKPQKVNTKEKINIGFDTETEKGKCFLIAYYNSDIDKQIKVIKNFDDILEFIFYSKFRDTNNFFYNINYDFQAIIKHLPIENLKELVKYSKTYYKDYCINFIMNKYFSIEKNKHIVKFYDLAQFYNFMSLNKAGEKFLNLNKINLKENEIDIKKLSLNKYLNDYNYKFYLDKYLIEDVKITKLLADKLTYLIKPYIIPKNFYSQATFSQQYFLENINKKMNLPNKNILQYALNSYQGGRFEVFKKGYFNKSFIQDIKSAYPYHNSLIPDTSKGIWKSIKEYDGESLISIFKINVNIHDLNISPLKYQLKNNLMIYPIGKFKNIYVNKKEIELLNDLGFKYKILSGFGYYDNNPEYPYSFLRDFYKIKEKYKSENNKELSWIPKIIMNGFYGKMIQLTEKLEFTKEYKGVKEDFNLMDRIIYKNNIIYVYKKYESGKLFNPIVANEITANTRVQLFNNSFKDIDNIIGFQTDSIISEKKLNLNFSDKLGDWELENKGELIILGSGIYNLIGKENKVRMRGFGKKLNLSELLNNNLTKNKIDVEVLRNLRLKRIIKSKNYNEELNINDKRKIELFNLLENEVKTININFDKKRIWDRNFINCNDALNNRIDSKPIEI
jgi:hypothetical protein